LVFEEIFEAIGREPPDDRLRIGRARRGRAPIGTMNRFEEWNRVGTGGPRRESGFDGAETGDADATSLEPGLLPEV
jgi:hypothetical protein